MREERRGREDEATGRRHLVLVPGFAGFDMLGALRYYEGVMRVFRQTRERWGAASIHFFPNIPTAGVTTRARALGVWLAKRLDRAVIQEEDTVHLIGHSTGGLDIRQLLLDLDATRQLEPFAPLPLSGEALLQRIHSVQFLSTPHHGTNLARWVSTLQPLPQCLVRALFLCLHRAGPWASASVGFSLSAHRPPSRTPNLIDAILDTLRRIGAFGTGYERAQARGVFYALLRWLNEMATDFSAIQDLRPKMGGACSPAHSPISHDREDEEFLLYKERRVRSIVTVAPPREEGCCDLYSLLHGLLGILPPPSLGDPCTLPLLLDPLSSRSIGRKENDGLVDGISMVWPDREHSLLLVADHADIIGHYGRPPLGEGYDLLPSGAAFDLSTFEQTWENIFAFALE